MQLRNNDGTLWVWWIGISRLLLLAVGASLGFRYAFDLSWTGAAVAVAVAFGLAGAVWGTFFWLSAAGRPIRLPRSVLLAAGRRSRRHNDIDA
jgi:hypothetical protein